MNPVRLQLSGFLSYREPVEISFEGINLACISGQNGAGKSSILDSITWALFGKARGKDEDIINSRADAAEVILDFTYEDSLYRVQRSKRRNKTSVLEFMIQDDNGRWRPLTESSARATEDRIQQVLRLDYNTFINASFFLQGKADQFAQQSPGERKHILSNILGLEIWETYRAQAVKNIRAQESERNVIAGQLQGIEEELAREPEYQNQLKQLENDLGHLTELLSSKAAALEAAVQQENMLKSLQKSLEEKSARLRSEQQRLANAQQQYEQRNQERETFQQALDAAPEIEKEYQAWLKDRQQLEHWEALAAQQHAVTGKRSAQQTVIDKKQAELSTLLNALRQRQAEADAKSQEAPAIEQSLERLHAEAKTLAGQKQQMSELNEQREALRLTISEMELNSQALARELGLLTERIARLGETEEELCPVCKKPLSAPERQRMESDLQAEKADLEVRQREITGQMQANKGRMKIIVDQLNNLTSLDARIQQNHQNISRDEARLAQILEVIQKFQTDFLPQLTGVSAALEKEDYESAARAEILKLDEKASQIGYDAAAHEAVRQSEQRRRSSEDQKRTVDNARATLMPLEREITTLAASIASEQQALESLTAEKQQSEQEVQELKSRLPDRNGLEREVYALKEQVNRKNIEMGGAQGRIKNLDNNRARQKSLIAQRDEIQRQISLLKQLERAFSKDGIPALLIEQALPEIETQANELLERLSNGTMALKFETQADYKDSKRSDKKETLEIKISDSSGTYREYEMYSGGEAFRVNFAIRLALSRVLAHRAGARLQTLVIDEGFGSQDADGRQRLIEAINQVRSDFEKILVITHLEELKDAFPARIEVEKGTSGSTVRVQML